MLRYGHTFFCSAKEPNKIIAYQYGLTNGHVIPSGFQIGDEIRIYTVTTGFKVYDVTLTNKTFAKEVVEFSDGKEVDAEGISSVYRIEGTR